MILLDTCVLLWLAIDQSGLSATAKKLLQAHAGTLFVSSVSAFEIGQKYARGKLDLHLQPEKWFPRAMELHGLAEAPMDSRIALAATALPDIHRDPFDRVLVATAITNNLLLLTPDPLIAQYPKLRVRW